MGQEDSAHLLVPKEPGAVVDLAQGKQGVRVLQELHKGVPQGLAPSPQFPHHPALWGEEGWQSGTCWRLAGSAWRPRAGSGPGSSKVRPGTQHSTQSRGFNATTGFARHQEEPREAELLCCGVRLLNPPQVSDAASHKAPWGLGLLQEHQPRAALESREPRALSKNSLTTF